MLLHLKRYYVFFICDCLIFTQKVLILVDLICVWPLKTEHLDKFFHFLEFEYEINIAKTFLNDFIFNHTSNRNVLNTVEWLQVLWIDKEKHKCTMNQYKQMYCINRYFSPQLKIWSSFNCLIFFRLMFHIIINRLKS